MNTSFKEFMAHFKAHEKRVKAHKRYWSHRIRITRNEINTLQMMKFSIESLKTRNLSSKKKSTQQRAYKNLCFNQMCIASFIEYEKLLNEQMKINDTKANVIFEDGYYDKLTTCKCEFASDIPQIEDRLSFIGIKSSGIQSPGMIHNFGGDIIDMINEDIKDVKILLPHVDNNSAI